MDNDDPYNDDTGISNKEWFELDAEQDVLLENEQRFREEAEQSNRTHKQHINDTYIKQQT